MRKNIIWAATLALSVAPLWAGTDNQPSASTGTPEVKTNAPETHIDSEIEAATSYVGGVQTIQGNAKLGNLTEIDSHFHYVVLPEIKEGWYFRGGVEFEQYSFGGNSAMPLPNTLQNLNAIVGLDFTLGESWVFRVEAAPGIYGDLSNIGWNDVNVPAVFGGTYLVNSDVQIIFGLSLDLWREYFLLPGAGIRWHFAKQWTLNAIPPRPRLEYELSKTVLLYAGAELKGTSYRSPDNFGDTHGRTNLNGTPISYWEARAGVGGSFKLGPSQSLSLDIEGGCMPFREFYFQRASTRFDSDGIAPYGQIAVRGTF